MSQTLTTGYKGFGKTLCGCSNVQQAAEWRAFCGEGLLGFYLISRCNLYYPPQRNEEAEEEEEPQRALAAFRSVSQGRFGDGSLQSLNNINNRLMQSLDMIRSKLVPGRRGGGDAISAFGSCCLLAHHQVLFQALKGSQQDALGDGGLIAAGLGTLKRAARWAAGELMAGGSQMLIAFRGPLVVSL